LPIDRLVYWTYRARSAAPQGDVMGLAAGLGAAFLAEVLVMSSLFKLFRRSEFKQAVGSFTALERLPQAVRRLSATFLPIVELLCALLLVLPVTRVIGAILPGCLFC